MASSSQYQPRHFTLGEDTFDLNDVDGIAAVLTNLGRTIATQHNTINNLQATAGGMNAQQFQQLLTSLAPAQPQRINQVENPVLSTPGNPVYYQDSPPPAGIEDVKGFPSPDPFKGTQTDARPFIIRVKAYFAAKPKAMRYTRSRILFTCDLLKVAKTAPWASSVKRAIAEATNGPHYYDDWEAFQAEFLKRYGLTDERAYYFKRMTQYVQNKDQDCKSYTDEFDRLRVESATSKDQAYFHLRNGTIRPICIRLMMRENPPDNYDSWVEAMVKYQTQLDLAKSITTTPYQAFFRGNAAQQRPTYVPKGHGDPMDVDAMKHGKGKGPQKKGQAKPKPLPKKTSNRLAPHPNAASSSKPSFPSSTSKPRKGNCFLCGKPGHFARDCRTSKEQVDMEYIREMFHAMEVATGEQDQEEDTDDVLEEEEEESVQPEEEDQDDLISFEEMAQSEDFEDAFGQGF
jgi:hypothetical protein